MHAPTPHIPPHRRLWLLAAIVAGFLALRLPAVILQPGQQDEQWFAVPGCTVAREGVPRIPYAPNRDPHSMFYRADEALFALPPGFFYAQAPFFLVLPAGYPTGRLPSLLSAVAAILLTYEFGRRAGGATAGLWGAGLYAASRVVLFPATFARPDMLCGTLGLGALLALWSWHDERRPNRLLLAGGLLGLGLLCHPFAAVYCVLSAVWVLLTGRGAREKMSSLALLVACSMLVAAAWLPLIVSHPEIFQSQFFNNVLSRSGPGLFSRLVFPWPYLLHQGRLLLEQAGVWQTGLMTAGLASATLLAWRQGGTPRRLVFVAWAAVFLLAAFQGLHPTKGYLCFTGALVFAASGMVLAQSVQRLTAGGRMARPAAWLVAAALFGLMLPGAGLRAWWVHVRHSRDPLYNGPRFVTQMLDDLPQEGRFVVDTQYVFDVWLSGRETVLNADPLNPHSEAELPYDLLIAGREGLDKRSPERYRGVFVRSYGRSDDPFACYAEVYRAP